MVDHIRFKVMSQGGMVPGQGIQCHVVMAQDALASEILVQNDRWSHGSKRSVYWWIVIVGYWKRTVTISLSLAQREQHYQLMMLLLLLLFSSLLLPSSCSSWQLTVAAGSESKVPVGLLEVRLELIPRLPESLAEDVVAAQLALEKNRQAERERLFLVYAKQWWKEFLQIRAVHRERLVKIFAQVS